MALGQKGTTEYIDRSDHYQLQIGPEADDHDLIFAALTPPKNLSPTGDQDYLTLVRRAKPTHIEIAENLFQSAALPVLTRDKAIIIDTLYPTILSKTLKTQEQVITARLDEDRTQLLATLKEDGIELTHIGPANEECLVASGLPMDLANVLWNDYRNGDWLPIGQAVFPDGDPTINNLSFP